MKKGDVFQMSPEEIARIRERKAKAAARAATPHKAVNNDLARRAASGDQSARTKLIEQNCKLVYKLAQRYHGADEAELIAEGLAGLCRAADTFDPERGVSFATHAGWQIKANIMRFLVNNRSEVKLGTTDAERRLFFRLSREENKLVAQGQEASSQAVADAVGGVTAKDVDNMKHRLSTAVCASLDAGNVSEEGSGRPLSERLSNGIADNPEHMLAEKEADALVRSLMHEFEQTLSEVDNQVWQSCIASEDSRNGTAVASATGLCKQRISQIRKDLVDRFVRYAKRNGLGK